MTIVVVLQHGDKERYPGDPGLTDLGYQQAERAAVAIGDLGQPVAVYSSPLRRALQTAGVVAHRCAVEVCVDERLRERINWEGDQVQSFESFLGDSERTTHDRDYIPAYGDSSRQTGNRMLQAIADATDRHPGALSVVVTHAGATVDLLRTLLGDEMATAEARHATMTTGIPPCALTVLVRDRSPWTVQRIADVQHLRPTRNDA